MTNEEFQRIVLQQMADFKDQLGEVKGQLGDVKGELGEVKGQLGDVKGQLGDVKGQLGDVKGQLGEVKGQLGDVKSHIGEVEGQLGDVKGQLSENTQFIKALLHRTEELDAKFDGLLHNTVNKDMLAHLATKEDIAALDSKFEVLNSRLFRQEAELVRIKAIK